MYTTELEYILAANKKAMELYKVSLETLMFSGRYDFMVFRFSEWDEVLTDLEEWDDYVSIDETTYHALYGNLCIKFRELIKYL